jgi:hypothetical protein
MIGCQMQSSSVKPPPFATISPILRSPGRRPAKVHVPAKAERRDRAGVTRAIHEGKGTGVTRDQRVRANGWRVQTATESAALRQRTATVRPSWGDSLEGGAHGRDGITARLHLHAPCQLRGFQSPQCDPPVSDSAPAGVEWLPPAFGAASSVSVSRSVAWERVPDT